MGDIPMPGGWQMSAMWTPMCGQTWLEAATAFVGMWTSMMAAMMLPLSTPDWPRVLRQGWRRHRSQHGCRSLLTAAACTALLTGISGLLIWAAAGVIVFALGSALAANLPRVPALARFVPLLSGVVVIIAGAVQFTSWKAGRIACCRCGHVDDLQEAIVPGMMFKRAFRLALQEGCCCANLMAVLLILGVMDLRAMVGITAAMLVERVAPADNRAVRGIGVVVVSIGMYTAARAALSLQLA